MTSRELVRRAITFEHPERLPFDMPVSGPSDVARARTGGSSDPRVRTGTDGHYVDHFGCEFAKLNERTMGQPTNFPLKDIRDLDDYRFPDPLDDARFATVEESLRGVEDKYVITYMIWFTFFERMHFIHGFRQTLEDLYTARSLMLDFADRIMDYQIAVVKELARRFPGGIQAVNMSDDWGSQSGTFISVDLFREFFLPRHKRFFGVIRDLGMDVWLHSCGQVMDFIPEFIDAGVQSLNLQQPRIFDLKELGKRFAGSVCFNVPVDIQATMPHGTREEIRQEAGELVRHLATEEGGFIASEHPDYRGNGIDPIKGAWAYEAFRDADPYRRGA